MSRATALESGGGSGSALLLRLFESSFFDVHLAIGYLKTYPNSIGITHYLINRLRSFEYEDVEFYWPQLCYLAITRPSPSTALENFILERCQEDAHIAVITLWYLQASLSDLAAMPKSDQFAACRRILNRVQAIIFSDPPLPSSTTSSPTKPPSSSASSAKTEREAEEKQEKINAPTASFVGIGLLLAAIGMPQLVNVAGRMVVEQGRRIEPPTRDESDDADEEEVREGGNSESGSEGEAGVAKAVAAKKTKSGIASALLNGTVKGSRKATGSSSSSSSSSKPKRTQTQPNYLPGDRITASPRIPLPSAHETRSMSFLPSPSAKSPTKPEPTSPGASSSSPLSPLERRGSLKHDVLRQSTTPSLSVPSLPMTSRSASNLLNSPSSTSQSLSGTTMPGYGLPKTFLSRLLLLHACRSQLDLIRSLQDISTRLVLVPKPARLSSLRAELTVLNHGLPRGCSLGMSTRPPPVALLPDSTPKPPASSPQPSSPFDKPHPPTPRRKQARVVRISPGESVVLNSADRAPFVIYVEVLEEDLDFNPDRRSNWEDLRRALREREGLTTTSIGAKGKPLAENGRLSLESGMDGFAKQAEGSTTPSKGQDAPATPHQPTSPSPGTPFAERAEYALGGGLADGGPGEGDVAAEPAGEMDLVEQLYGDISLRDDPLAEQPVDDVEEEIHNRDVDEAAWRRKDEAAKAKRRDRTASSASSSTAARSRSSISSASGEPFAVGPKAAKSSPSGTARPGGRSIASRAPISLEDYAERMRMAAIMLAQLDASQTASRGVVGAGTAAAGTLVTLPVYTVAGIGGVVGAGLGAGLGAVKARLSKKETPAASAGQGGAGTRASLDTASAAEGTSAVAGQPPLNPVAAALSHGAAEASLTSGSAPSTSAAVAGTSGSSTPAPLPSQRPRVLAPQDAAAIRDRIMSEMMALEEERMERMRGDVESRSGWTAAAGSAKTQDNTVVMRAVNKDDPSGAVFAESFTAKTARIRSASPFGHLPSWSLLSCIVKTGADLRQEQLAVQLISEFGRIWKEENCPGWVYYFRMIVTSENSGLIETINDAVSVHSLKKNAYARRAKDGTQAFDSYSLYDHFVNTYGSPDSSKFRKAQEAFIQSLAAYSVICYLLQLKDRHNGNILLDRQGHLIHIDFGFMLSNSPGSIGFEMAPFKLPQDYIDILGGFDSPKFAEFRALFKRCFRDARKHAERIITLVELMQKDSSLPCFSNGELTSQQLRERFMLSLPQAQLDEYADKLILNSAQSSFTRLYDLFQGYSNGILI